MKLIQAASRLVPRVAGTRMVTTSSVKRVSMKEAYGNSRPAGVVPATSSYQKMQRLQQEFNKNPDLMIWQKRGVVDSLPYLTTMLCVTGGMLFVLAAVWDMSWPKSPK